MSAKGPNRVLLCQVGSTWDERSHREVVELCASYGAELFVVMAVRDRPVPEGCCGIGAGAWEKLMEEELNGTARGIASSLEALGMRPTRIVTHRGPSFAEIARAAAARHGCSIVAGSPKPRPWSNSGLPRADLRRLRAAAGPAFVELGRGAQSAVSAAAASPLHPGVRA